MDICHDLGNSDQKYIYGHAPFFSISLKILTKIRSYINIYVSGSRLSSHDSHQCTINPSPAGGIEGVRQTFERRQICFIGLQTKKISTGARHFFHMAQDIN